MATPRDDELEQLHAQGAAIALEQGGDAGKLAAQLASTQSAAMGQGVADRYASIGARWLADQVPTRLDSQLVDRLVRQGFRKETLDTVRVHRGTKAQDAASALGARAFAIGDQDIFFGQGEFDPNSRSGRAVIAHEVAHIAPPDAAPAGDGGFSAGPAAMPSNFGSMSSSFGAPVLNERKRGDEDAAGSEAHERRARAAEARVYAEEDGAASPSLPSAPAGEGHASAPADGAHAKMDPHKLEAKVLQILGKWERTEVERSGAF